MDRVTNCFLCALCGGQIPRKANDEDDSLSMDHVPPLQFYPKEVRTQENPNLWLVPTHKRCNAGYRVDEEYFYHAVYALVHNGNSHMGQTIHRDLKRRAKKTQTPAMIRRLLRDTRTVTDSGIVLPPGVVWFGLDEFRMQRVAIKIAQGLFYLEEDIHIPRKNCKDIRLCQEESEVPELYRLSWSGAENKAVLPSVFSYHRFEFDNLHLYSMLFWEAFMFCLAFENPQNRVQGSEATR